jgi:RNA polymerase sigma-70 factor, ECF subfamily
VDASATSPSRPDTERYAPAISAPLTDHELVAAARSGDRNALDQLLRRHYDRAHGVCRRLMGNAAEADDAAQETMIRVVRGLDSFDGRSSFATWVYRIATNTSLDELRKRSRRPHLHLVDDDGQSPQQVDDLAHRRVDAVVDRLSIDAALAALPDDYRAAVVLRDVADLDYSEIATILGIPVGTVKSRIARGRAQLVERLGNQDPPSERPTPRSP